MSFNVPQFDQVEREGDYKVPDRGRYDFTLTGIECSRTKKNADPMLILEHTIDRGEFAGHEIKEYYAFGEYADLAWSRLACLCDAAGFSWDQASSLEAFAAQFPVNQMRYSMDIEHRHSIQAYLDDPNPEQATQKSETKTQDTPYEKWLDVPLAEYERWEGKKFKTAQVRDGFDMTEIYQAPQGERELQMTEEDTVHKKKKKKQPTGNGSAKEPAAAKVGAANDDLPF